jgi:hypothetical protein
MPLGDSITVGNASGVVPDNDAYWVSYRKELWESLNLAGYNVDFVGSVSDGYAFDPPFDSQHEGHGGWRDDQIASNIYNWLVSTPADVTLLHIGTNGLSSSPDDVEDILDEIDRYEADHDADVTVVLARIINRRDGSTTTTAFNNNVAAMAQDRVDNPANDAYPDKIIIVDMENGAGIIYGQAPASGDMWDNLHPYETGYAKMSNAWLYGDNFGSDGLADFLPVCGPPSPTTPLITSAPVTDAFMGWPYSYDVEASGFPAPTFTLTTKPVGMTIDQTTGLINWTPPATGDFDVTVEAINSEGSDDQSFTITVADAPACPADINSYWKLDESSAPYENYIGGADATCFNCPAATTGLVQGAQQFDGQNDEVNVADNDQFDWSAGDEFSIEYWMKSTSNCSGNEVIVGRQGVSHPNPHWWTGCFDTGDQAIFILFDKNGGDGGNGNWPASGTDISDGQWHHVVAVKDTTHLRIYVDGLEKDAVAKSYGAGFDSITPLNIGYLNLSDHYRFEGTLDEVAVYDQALSPSEIQQHYNAGLAGYGYCADWQVAPTITSTPITGAIVNLPYTYDVDADGFPAPTYTLTTKPAGMSIDENTGLITWMPAAVGDYDVTVEAHNSAGSDVQDYTINVIAGDERITDGLLVLYPFDEGGGMTVHDRSGVGSALDLTIDDGGAVSWPAGDCGLAINSSTVISSVVPASKIINAAKASDEITIEGWVKPANTTQSGPARIVTLSQDPSPNGANFVLGQKQDQYDVRLRTTATDQYGNPSLSSPSGSLTTDLTHVVYTRDVTGTTKIYLDGSLATSGSVSGDFSAWNDSYWLGLGNEPTGDRPWLGELYLVAVYGRALNQVEVQKNFSAGSCAGVPEYSLTVNVDGSGDVALDPAGGTYQYGQVVTMTAMANPGWIFSDWSGDLTSTVNPVQITIDGDKVVTATFTQEEYTLTVNIDGQGSVEVDPDKATYHQGEVITLTATADPDWIFFGWSGDVTGLQNPTTLTMMGDAAVTAKFIEVTFPVYFPVIMKS